MSKDDLIEVNDSFFPISAHFTDFNSTDHNSTHPFPKRQFEQAFKLTYLFLKNGHNSPNLSSTEGAKTFDTALGTGEVAVISIDSHGKVLFFNRCFVLLWNISPGVLATQKYAQYVAYCRQQLKDPDSFDQDELTLKDGRRLYQASRQQQIDSETVVFTRVYQSVGKPGQPVRRGVESYAEELDSDAAYRDKENRDGYSKDDKAVPIEEVVGIERYLAERRSQLLSKVAHRSVDALNLVSLATNFLQTYGSSLSLSQKQSYTQKTSDAIEQLSALLQETECISQLSLSRLNFATLGWPTNSEPILEPQLCQQRCDVCKMCHTVVDIMKSQYCQHAFVVFCTSRRSVIFTNSLVLRLVISHVVDMLSRYSQMSLVKIVVSKQSNYLSLKFFENNTILPAGDEGRLPQMKWSSSAPTTERERFESEVLLIETLLEVLSGLAAIEKGQNGVVVTLKLPFSVDSAIAL